MEGLETESQRGSDPFYVGHPLPGEPLEDWFKAVAEGATCFAYGKVGDMAEAARRWFARMEPAVTHRLERTKVNLGETIDVGKWDKVLDVEWETYHKFAWITVLRLAD